MKRGMEQRIIRPSVALAFFYCAVAATFLTAGYIGAHKFGNDFGVYWRAAHQPLDAVYAWPGRYPFPYMPTMLLWTSPLRLLPRWPAYFAWTAISVVVFLFVCRRYLTGPSAALVLISPPLLRGVYTGQVCAALAALTIWACRTANRTAAGIAFGVIASVKPQLVLMAPLLFVLNRDWRAFRSSAATFAATVILALLFFGPDRWPEWLASMNHFHHAVADTGVITVATTPAAVAERYGYAPLPFLILGAVVGAGIVYACRDSGPLEKAAAITVASVMASPYALIYDLTVAMPLLAIAVFEGRFLPAIGMATGVHPVPLLASTWELIRSKVPRLWPFSTDGKAMTIRAEN